MSWITMDKARVMKDDCTGTVGICPAPGEKVQPIGAPTDEQIEQAVNRLAKEQPELFGGAQIDDSVSSATSVYSSSKVDELIGGALNGSY